MREKIQNRLEITCEGIDLTELSNIEFYISQSKFFGCYTPSVTSSKDMIVIIPFEDAKKLKHGEAELQFAFIDANGNPDASEVVKVKVNDLLKEVGYDPVQSKK